MKHSLFILFLSISIVLVTLGLLISIVIISIDFYLKKTLKVPVRMWDFMNFDENNEELKQVNRQWWDRLRKISFFCRLVFYFGMSTFILAFAIGFTMLPEY